MYRKCIPVSLINLVFCICHSDEERYRYREYQERGYGERHRDRSSREKEERHRERRHREKEDGRHKSSRRYVTSLQNCSVGWLCSPSVHGYSCNNSNSVVRIYANLFTTSYQLQSISTHQSYVHTSSKPFLFLDRSGINHCVISAVE